MIYIICIICTRYGLFITPCVNTAVKQSQRCALLCSSLSATVDLTARVRRRSESKCYLEPQYVPASLAVGVVTAVAGARVKARLWLETANPTQN